MITDDEEKHGRFISDVTNFVNNSDSKAKVQNIENDFSKDSNILEPVDGCLDKIDCVIDKSVPSYKLNLNSANSELNATTDTSNVDISANDRTQCTKQEGNVNSNCIVKRTPVILSLDELNSLSKEEIIDKWKEQELYIKYLQSSLHEALEAKQPLHHKTQLNEVQKKEQYHVMRLATKEHELQEMLAQVEELKTVAFGGNSLKNTLLDPAVNLLFERMKRELDSSKSKLEETQHELAAWKFTPDSNTGKQLMAKCRLLIKENEELGKMISSGRLAKLEGELALQKNFGEELKKSQSELEEFLQEMDEDTEGMQSTILYLQSELRQAKDKISLLSAQLSSGGKSPGVDVAALTSDISHGGDRIDGFPSRPHRTFGERRAASSLSKEHVALSEPRVPIAHFVGATQILKENGDAKCDPSVGDNTGHPACNFDVPEVDDRFISGSSKRPCSELEPEDGLVPMEDGEKRIHVEFEMETNGSPPPTSSLENGLTSSGI